MGDRQRAGSGPGRREFVALGLGAFAVAAWPLTRGRRRRLVRRRLPLMGTVAEVGVVHTDPAWAWSAAGAALDALSACEARLTRFRDDSDVGRVNASAAGAAVEVGPWTADVLRTGLRIAHESGGRFDPCLGEAVRAWDVAHRTTPLTEAERLDLAGRHPFQALTLESTAEGGRILRRTPDVVLDLGGIGKGYGVDRAVDALRAWGVQDGLVNVGGDLYALGFSPDGDPWVVGVRAPDDPERMLAELPLSEGAVATSGDYQQGFDHEGRRYAHILDPATGAPVRSSFHTVTVGAPTCVEADAWATAVFGLDPARAEALLRRASPTLRLVHVA